MVGIPMLPGRFDEDADALLMRTVRLELLTQDLTAKLGVAMQTPGVPLQSVLGGAPAAPGPNLYINDTVSPPVLMVWVNTSSSYVSYPAILTTGSGGGSFMANGLAP